jgi:hypothetical protein
MVEQTKMLVPFAGPDKAGPVPGMGTLASRASREQECTGGVPDGVGGRGVGAEEVDHDKRCECGAELKSAGSDGDLVTGESFCVPTVSMLPLLALHKAPSHC